MWRRSRSEKAQHDKQRDDNRIRDASGRRIAFCEYGDPTGRPVVVVHGSPGSRYEGLSLDNTAATAGIRLTVPDRPSFGRTDPHMDKGFHFLDNDYVTLIDHLELDLATLMDFSGAVVTRSRSLQPNPNESRNLCWRAP
ncbi:alpha/beta hydrolase [Rhodococcus erythropolis]|uniref:alpha/beta fold hydrolase n=1 Tax=Rhodococcus erythropolis TaxID=1833 RepID=UPI002948D87D|nr:alpha/beta hydrolase [Rhodococcus erythropolis]MDV6276631.1 alpha/beta hydrolase [Rhodococcus erythropolis]